MKPDDQAPENDTLRASSSDSAESSPAPQPSRDNAATEPASSDGPPCVDEQLLRALVRNELPEPQARELYRLIHTQRDWDEAHTRIVIEEARRREQQDQS